MYVSKARKTKWSTEEDASLRAAVSNFPYKKGSFAVDWKAVSKLTGRTTKQCRERWINVLDPSIRRDAWSFDEIRTLFNAQEELGNKWAAIASRLPGRPETAVKNTFYAAVRREQRRAWAAKHGQPIPEPFHPAVPMIPAVGRLLASMGECMPPLPGLSSRSSSFDEDAFTTGSSTPMSTPSTPMSGSRKRPSSFSPGLAAGSGNDGSLCAPEAELEDEDDEELRPRKFSVVQADSLFDDILASEFFASVGGVALPHDAPAPATVTADAARNKSNSLSDAESESLLSDAEPDYMAAMMDPLCGGAGSYGFCGLLPAPGVGSLRMGVDAGMLDDGFLPVPAPVSAPFSFGSPAHQLPKQTPFTLAAIFATPSAGGVDAVEISALDAVVDDDFSWLQ